MNMNFHRIICLLVLIVSATSIAKAQEIRVDIIAEPESLRVGDLLKLNLYNLILRALNRDFRR